MIYETDRLVLRPYEPSDLQAHIEIHNHPDMAPYVITLGPRATPIGIWRAFASILGHWQIRAYGEWMVVERASSQPIGRVGFYFPDGAPEIELGWAIRRSHWGRGFATEATAKAVQLGLGALGFDHFISAIRTNNQRSIRVAEKVGLQLERTEERRGEPFHVYGARRS
jgi:RimJ/RimL family protein N-acetyltransferase